MIMCWLWKKSHHFCFLLAEITWSDLFFLWLSWFWKSTVTIHVTSRPWPSLTMYHPPLFRLWLKSKNSAANFTFRCASVTPLQWPLGSTHVPECKGCSVMCFWFCFLHQLANRKTLVLAFPFCAYICVLPVVSVLWPVLTILLMRVWITVDYVVFRDLFLLQFPLFL